MIRQQQSQGSDSDETDRVGPGTTASADWLGLRGVRRRDAEARRSTGTGAATVAVWNLQAQPIAL